MPADSDETKPTLVEPVPWWDYRERTFQASSNWFAANPRRAFRLTILGVPAVGIGFSWWTMAQLMAQERQAWIPPAVAGGLLAAALTAYWGYVGLVRSYQVGWIGKVITYAFGYGLAAAGLAVYLTHDHVSVVSIFSGALVGVAMILLTPVLLLGHQRYLRDPEAARRLVRRTTWLRGLRPPFPGPPPGSGSGG